MILLGIPILPSAFNLSPGLHHTGFSFHTPSFLQQQIVAAFYSALVSWRRQGSSLLSWSSLVLRRLSVCVFSALLSLPLMATKLCLVSVVVLGREFSPSPQKWQISTCHKQKILSPRWISAIPLGVGTFCFYAFSNNKDCCLVLKRIIPTKTEKKIAPIYPTETILAPLKEDLLPLLDQALPSQE